MKQVEDITRLAAFLILGSLLLLHFCVTIAAIWHAFYLTKIGPLLGFPIGLLACAVNISTAIYFWKVNHKNISFEAEFVEEKYDENS